MEKERNAERERYAQAMATAAEKMINALHAVEIIDGRRCKGVDSQIEIKRADGQVETWRVLVEHLGDGGTT